MDDWFFPSVTYSTLLQGLESKAHLVHARRGNPPSVISCMWAFDSLCLGFLAGIEDGSGAITLVATPCYVYVLGSGGQVLRHERYDPDQPVVLPPWSRDEPLPILLHPPATNVRNKGKNIIIHTGNSTENKHRNSTTTIFDAPQSSDILEGLFALIAPTPTSRSAHHKGGPRTTMLLGSHSEGEYKRSVLGEYSCGRALEWKLRITENFHRVWAQRKKSL
ncbi:hypothetical protein K503DRAFT_856864 [Rhizopogon vinicolor AM-OR11-026]|uniref:Uncharacterized protein n=1 Tax=Rhizopogon vinicolor AM-OR11-026 TaxID=1314800 RepID=A0A1B7N019_9AGAM|nr:hypothetical protein K503DRAFT_856864 [Rhizopogon vinicolor AM-OR11-026]